MSGPPVTGPPEFACTEPDRHGEREGPRRRFGNDALFPARVGWLLSDLCVVVLAADVYRLTGGWAAAALVAVGLIQAAVILSALVSSSRR